MKHIQQIVASGYLLVTLLIGCIAYIWHNEWQEVEELESPTLANVGLLAPCLNSITNGVTNIFANIFKVATRRTYTTLFGKEPSFIVNVKYLTSTFYLTVTYGKFIAKYLVQFFKEQVTSRPCTSGVNRQPGIANSDADFHLF